MARLSPQFLANLGRPQFAQGMFNIGQAIGGIPGQMEERKKREQFNQMMQQGQAAMASGNATQLAQIGQQLTAAGYAKEGQALTQASISASAKQKAQAEQMGQQRTSAQMLMTELQDYANNPQLPQPVRQQAGNLLRAAAQAGDRATLLEPRVAQLRKTVGQTPDPITMTPGAVLLDPVTREPIYQTPFKPEKQAAPKVEIIKPSKEDPNFRIFNERGELVNTIPVKQEGKTLEQIELDNNRVSQIVRIKADVEELMNKDGKYSGWSASGVTGQILGNWWGGSKAYDRNAVIRSLKASLGLDTIKDMKESSKTGATGLGPISNVELDALQSEVASLSIGMSEVAQLDSLQKIFDHLDRIQQVASGVVPIDAIDWNSPEYQAAGYGKDKQTGTIMYTPQGKTGPVYKLENGVFKKTDI